MTVDPLLRSVIARSAVYDINGRCVESMSDGFADVVAAAHAAHQRPRCLCQRNGERQGIEMYVARLGDGYIVKRMPETGPHHAPGCPSYEPRVDAPGAGSAPDSAIAHDPVTGKTTLTLNFPLSTSGTQSTAVLTSQPGRRDGIRVGRHGLSLRDLLLYLWDEAGLTQWRPGFAGKRSWATVRRHLLQAADNMVSHRRLLRSRLYIPEVFSVEQRDVINARRRSQWAPFVAAADHLRPLMLLIGEVKRIDPMRDGLELTIKHVPGQRFALAHDVARRFGRRLPSEVSWWRESADMHLVIMATFSVTLDGAPRIVELSLMLVTEHWLPVTDRLEKDRVERQVRAGRSFIQTISPHASAPISGPP